MWAAGDQTHLVGEVGSLWPYHAQLKQFVYSYVSDVLLPDT